MTEHESKLYKTALALSVFTIVYNLIEGVVSVWFGLEDETLALFGFGADSFVETISALGVMQMVVRIRRNPNSSKGPFEVRALQITGWCFYALAVILSVTAVYNIYTGHEPESTMAGIIIAIISIIAMWVLIRAKISVGRRLNSSPFIADANCNKVCLYMSVVLLISSVLYELFHIPYIDALGAAGLVYFSIQEGREAFEKSRGIDCSDGCGH